MAAFQCTPRTRLQRQHFVAAVKVGINAKRKPTESDTRNTLSEIYANIGTQVRTLLSRSQHQSIGLSRIHIPRGMSRQVFARMPHCQNVDGDDNWRKFQASKEDLLGRQCTGESLRRLGKPETCSNIDEEGGQTQSRGEGFQRRENNLPSTKQRDTQKNTKHKEGKHLKGKPSQQDIIRHSRILPIRRRHPNQRRPRHLRDGRHHITGDENPQDHLRPQGRILAAGAGDQHGQHGVDGGAEEDGRHHDEEVLDDEVEDRVGVHPRREQPERVAHHLHARAQHHRAEVPAAVSEEPIAVQQEGDAEEHRAQDREDAGWSVPE
jgi:hypothetical protein